MFEVGKTYEIRMIEGGEETTSWHTVERYEHPLLKLADVKFEDDDIMGPAGAEMPGPIINVTSPNFISALEKDVRPISDHLKPGRPPAT